MNRPFFCIFLTLTLCLLSCRPIMLLRFYKSDYHSKPAFDKREVNKGATKSVLYLGNPNLGKKIDAITLKVKKKDQPRVTVPLDQYIDEYTTTTAFLVIRNDSIIWEHYYEGFDKTSRLTSFSVAKSFTSALIGIAVQEGTIESIEDPVTKYIPELKEKHENWSRLKVSHLLDMRSGIKFEEDYEGPYSGIANLYMGKDAMKVVSKLKFAHEPGTKHYYSSMDTQILGLILQRASGQKLAQYLSEKLWVPMGMESNADWSVDSDKFGNTKAFCCIQAVARDYARFGLLYLHGGKWNGKQIIDPEWVKASTQPKLDNDCYQRQWYSNNYYDYDTTDGKREIITYPDSLSAVQAMTKPNQHVGKFWATNNKWAIENCGPGFFAYGLFGQEINVDPERKLVFVRLGKHANMATNLVMKRIKEVLDE